MQDTAAVAANPRSLAVPVSTELTFTNSVQPGFYSEKANFRPVTKEPDGERRVQDSCDTERTAFYGCLSDDSCQGCYESAIQTSIAENTLCRVLEIDLCTSSTTCNCGSGCESEAELLFQCVAEEGGCTKNINCAETACDEEFLAMVDCDSTLGSSCLSCVGETHDALFPTNTSTASCQELEDAVCLETCGCDFCSDEVAKYYSCLYSRCTNLDCLLNLDPAPTPTPPAPTPTPTPTPPPPPTPCGVEKEAFYACLPDETCQGCYQGAIQTADAESTLCLEYESFLCAIPTSCPCGSGCQAEAEIVFQCAVEEAGCSQTVNCDDKACESETISSANCDSTLENSCLECMSEAHDALFPSEESTASCMELQGAICQAFQTCGCDYCSDKVRDWYSCLYSDDCPAIECRTPAPTMAPTMSPTEVDACYVCGDPNLTVDPSKMVIIDGNSRPCGEVQEEYTSKQVTEFECNVLVDLVEKSCGCQDIPPQTVTPTSQPVQVQEMSPSNSNLAALSALVAIPFVAIIVYLVMRRKKEQNSGDNWKASRNPDAPEYEFNETPPVTPTRTTPSRRYNGDHSITESSEEDHYMYGRNHGGEVASQNSGGVPPSGNSIQSGGDQSGGTRQSRDPSGIRDYTAPHAAPPAQQPTTGGEYVIQPKDQCRSVVCEPQVPIALIANDAGASDQWGHVVDGNHRAHL